MLHLPCKEINAGLKGLWGRPRGVNQAGVCGRGDSTFRKRAAPLLKGAPPKKARVAGCAEHTASARSQREPRDMARAEEGS